MILRNLYPPEHTQNTTQHSQPSPASLWPVYRGFVCECGGAQRTPLLAWASTDNTLYISMKILWFGDVYINMATCLICIPLLKKFTSDVDNLEAGEGKNGEGVQLGLVGTPHEEHLLLQSWQQRGNLILNPDKHRN